MKMRAMTNKLTWYSMAINLMNALRSDFVMPTIMHKIKFYLGNINMTGSILLMPDFNLIHEESFFMHSK